MSVQTSYDQAPAVALDGMIADGGPRRIISRIVEETNGIKPGRMVLKGSSDDQAKLATAQLGADVDAIIATIASAGTQQVLDDADLDGAIGGDEMDYGYRLQLVLDSNADWDETTAVLKGVDADTGEIVEENLSISDGGNETLQTTGYFSRVISLTIPAQSGTGGSATLGIVAGARLNRGAVLGVSVRETAREELATQVFEDEEAMGVLDEGRIYASAEAAVTDGARVYVRLTAAGAEELGAFRADDDGGDCAPFPARWRTTTSGAGLAVMELDQN